jgi:uncharacterized membrane protein YebE (DUF533 family)
MKKILLVFMVVMLFASASFAQGQGYAYGHRKHRKHNIDQHQKNQEKRIRKGLKSGSLTTNEANQLLKEQDAIKAERRAARADGVVTKQERKSIKAHQKQANRDIKSAKHNGERRR